MTNRQKWAVAAIPAGLMLAIVLTMALAWGDLPDPMATHWDLAGTPNGHMPATVLLLVFAGVFAAVWLAVWGAARRMPFEARSFISGAAGIGGLLATVTWLTVDANRGVAEWTQAAEINGIHIVIILAAAVAFGTAGWFLAGPSTALASAVEEPGPMLDLAPGTNAVWSGRGRGTILIVIGMILAGVAIAIWSIVSLVLAAVAVVVLMFSEVRATVSERGVVVSLGWLGIPSWLVPLDHISGATVEEVSPLSYGGWGYRVRPGARAVVVRGGDSLRLQRVNRPALVLTVDDSERGAGLINAMLARR